MSDLRQAAQQALKALVARAERGDGAPETVAALRAALAQEEPTITPEELSAALGWPGGISDPVLEKTELLQMVAQGRTQQAQEPVAWMHYYANGDDTTWEVDALSDPLTYHDTKWQWVSCSPLYATPPDHREAMRLALEALEVCADETSSGLPAPAIEALKKALGETNEQR